MMYDRVLILAVPVEALGITILHGLSVKQCNAGDAAGGNEQ
jgi:hypothetical protein